MTQKYLFVNKTEMILAPLPTANLSSCGDQRTHVAALLILNSTSMCLDIIL